MFFDSDQYALRNGIDTDKEHESDVQMEGIGPMDTKRRQNEYDTSPMTKILRKKLISRLGDWFSSIEVKSQQNITMNLCVRHTTLKKQFFSYCILSYFNQDINFE